MRLINQPERKNGESRTSALFRLGLANYCTDIGKLLDSSVKGHDDPLRYLSLNYQNEGTILSDAMDRLLLDNEFDPKLTVLNQYDDIIFGSKPTEYEVKRVYVNRNTRFCPHCMDEDFYHQCIWEVGYVTACLKHQVYLVDSCPTCKSPVTLKRLLLDNCTCGQSLREVNPVKNTVPQSLLVAQQLIQDLLNRRRTKVVLPDGTELDKTEFLELFHLGCRVLDGLPTSLAFCEGAIPQDDRMVYSKPQSNFAKSVEQMSAFSLGVYRMLMEPDIYLPEIFSYLEGVRTGRKVALINLREFLDHPKAGAYKERYHEYLSAVTTKYVKQKHMQLQDSPYLTLTDAQRYLKCGYYRLQEFCEAGVLKYAYTEGEHKSVTLIDRRSAEGFRRFSNGLKDSYQVMHQLDIHFREIKYLIEAGLLEEYNGPQCKSTRGRMFEGSTVKAFLQQLVDHCELVGDDFVDGIPLNKVRSKTDNVRSLGAIASAIIEGKVKGFACQNARSLAQVFIKDVGLLSQIKNQKGWFYENKQFSIRC